MKTRISKNLVSFSTIRRGNWQIKLSIYKDKQLLLYAMHIISEESLLKVFYDNDEAAIFINFLAERDDYE